MLSENATGKSTVADALEWHFTGEIGLPRHEGRAGSLRNVGASADEQTSVTVQTTGVLGGSLEPGGAPDARVRTAGRELYLLRGHTLTWFVERTKGEKWKALAELLGLDEIDQLRLDLQKARNELRDAAEAAVLDLKSAAAPLASKMSVVSAPEILGAVTQLCRRSTASGGAQPQVRQRNRQVTIRRRAVWPPAGVLRPETRAWDFVR